MKSMKKSIFLFMCIVCIEITLTGTAKNVDAHGKMVKGVYWLNLDYYDAYGNGKGENYDSFNKADVTNDGKKDTVETVCTEKTCSLYVNGTQVKMWNRKKTYTEASTVGIITLENKKSYLFICEFQHKGARSEFRRKGTTICRLCQVNNGRLATKFDFEKMFDRKLLSGNDFIYCFSDNDEKDSDDSFLPIKVSKNTFYVDLFITTKSLGQVTIPNLKITYKKGKLQLVADNYKARLAEWSWADNKKIKYYSLAEKVQTMKSPGSSKKSAVLKKGTQFKLQKVSLKGKNICAQIKTKNKKTYWIKLSTSNSSMVKKRSTIDYRG